MRKMSDDDDNMNQFYYQNDERYIEDSDIPLPLLNQIDGDAGQVEVRFENNPSEPSNNEGLTNNPKTQFQTSITNRKTKFQGEKTTQSIYKNCLSFFMKKLKERIGERTFDHYRSIYEEQFKQEQQKIDQQADQFKQWALENFGRFSKKELKNLMNVKKDYDEDKKFKIIFRRVFYHFTLHSALSYVLRSDSLVDKAPYFIYIRQMIEWCNKPNLLFNNQKLQKI